MFIILVPCQGWTQNVYKLKYHVDIPVTAIGIGGFTASTMIARQKTGASVEQVQLLDKSDIWGFDRSAANRWCPKSAEASDVLLYSSLAAPVLLFMNKNVRREKYTVGAMWAQTMLLSAGLTCFVKEVASRNRPYMYNKAASDDIKTSKDARLSFFSGHTSMAASSCFFMAKVYTDLNPDSRIKPLIWTGAAVLPAAVGVLRYTAGKHYPSDILVGYITGAAIGYLVPYLHKKRAEKLEYTVVAY